MFDRVVSAIRAGRSPVLFTGIEPHNLGKNALIDDAVLGDKSLIPAGFSENLPLPAVSDGVLIERITTAPELVLCGAGHVSVQTAKVAKLCGFSVTVIDDRADFANAERFPDADRIWTQTFDEAIAKIETRNAFYVIVTRGHKDDKACLERILKRPFTYCGMIGSRTKVALVFDDLLANGFSKEQLSRVHAPIGLSIGAVTPEEIAVSIVGELIRVKNASSHGTEWDDALQNAVLSSHSRYAMVTLIRKRGSAPRTTGARMIVHPDGRIVSSIGGGFGEFQAAQYASEMLQNGPAAKCYTCSMNNTDAAKVGMICGGTVDVLIQIVEENDSWKISN